MDPVKQSIVKEKDKQRKRISREKEKVVLMQHTAEAARLLTAKRLKEADRKRAYRWAKKKDNKQDDNDDTVPVTPTKVYPTKQAAGKALMRLKVKLPMSPTKRKALTLKLALDEGNTLVSPGVNRCNPNRISKELEDKVSNFYMNDDVSWAAPGMRDAVTIGDGKKQKRYMTVNINEAYQLFKEQNPDAKIGKSKFFEFRPKHVLLMADIPHNVCICKTHDDMDSLLSGLAKVVPNTPRTGRHLLDSVVCSQSNASCMLSNCTSCSTSVFKVESGSAIDMESETVKWVRWEDLGGRPIKTESMLSINYAESQVNTLLSQYKAHCFIKDEQSSWFKTSKNSIPLGQAVIQVDFAENYAAVSQDEVQSAHWSHQQVTIFTAVAWMSNGLQSFVVVSDDLQHDKVAVWVMLKAILKHIKENYQISTVKIFSDGCAAQFKNRYTMMNLIFMQDDFDITGEWAFFASSHGKGAVDAIGGTIKRNVWRAVKSRKVIVNTAEAFYKVSADHCHNGHYFWYTVLSNWCNFQCHNMLKLWLFYAR